MTNGFDSLNNLTTDEEELVKKQIREYFEEMELPKDEIEQRILLALDLEMLFRNLFLLMLGADVLGELENQQAKFEEYAYKGYNDILVKQGYSNDTEYQAYGYIEQYAKQRCKDIVDTTILHKVDSFYLSVEHSIAIGEDESNAVCNYDREQKAIAQGYTMKTWISMRDKRVRHTHVLADGQTVSVFKPFHIGKSQMMFPMDTSLGCDMKEVYHCRCVLDYSGKK